MRLRFFQQPKLVSAVGALLTFGGILAGSILLSGCNSDAKYSDKEVAQFKQGPPKEMPEQARKLFEQASKAGTGGPPPEATPPGAGAGNGH